MLVVLGESDDESFGSHAESAATAHLHVRALQLGRHFAVTLQHYDVETVAMAVADQNVAGVARVNPAGIRCQRLVSKTTEKLPILSEYGNTVALQTHHVAHVTCSSAMTTALVMVRKHSTTIDSDALAMAVLTHHPTLK